MEHKRVAHKRVMRVTMTGGEMTEAHWAFQRLFMSRDHFDTKRENSFAPQFSRDDHTKYTFKVKSEDFEFRGGSFQTLIPKRKLKSRKRHEKKPWKRHEKEVGRQHGRQHEKEVGIQHGRLREKEVEKKHEKAARQHEKEVGRGHEVKPKKTKKPTSVKPKKRRDRLTRV